MIGKQARFVPIPHGNKRHFNSRMTTGSSNSG
jgi:hypothetical protein